MDTLLSKECLGKFKQSLKSPTIFHSSELEIALDLHVDDGYVTGPAANMSKVFPISSPKFVLKLPPIISVGNSFEHVGALRVIDDEGMWVRERKLGQYDLQATARWCKRLGVQTENRGDR